MFIKLKEARDHEINTIYINFNLISYMVRAIDFTHVQVGSVSIRVGETPEEIMKLIEETSLPKSVTLTGSGINIPDRIPYGPITYSNEASK